VRPPARNRRAAGDEAKGVERGGKRGRKEGVGREEGDKCVTRGRRAGTLTTRLVRCKDGMLRPKKSLSKGRRK